ncbi:MAG: phosphatase PAP2 family protein [Candidatus Harrisonbacteria bacterium]|nr:phosphatase PAP2 family protein [Candidatus Harrisonbacteria bacterium]
MDQQLFLFIHNLAGKSRLLDFLAIFFAEYAGYFLIVAAIILISALNEWKKRFYYFAWIILSVVLSRGILTEAIRLIYFKERPFLALGFNSLISQADKGAFPSGHAAFYFALAIPLFFINKKIGWYSIAVAVSIGLARVWVGVHWPLDVVSGAVVASFSVYVVRLILEPYQVKKISGAVDGREEGILG